MKRTLAILFLFFLSIRLLAGDSIRPSREKYISEHKDDAIRDMKKTGVPASITLAQACLESHDGASALAREANNHFGIKCSDWTGPYYIQDDDKKDECFRKYNSTLESYDDHSLFLSTRPRYAFLFKLELTDYKGWAKGLKKAGYATDPNYADRLIKIIEDNQLYLLDLEKESQLTASVNNEPISPEIESKPKKIYVPSVEPIDAFNERKIYTKNGLEYIIAKKGDDLHTLAQELKLGYWQLPKYNEMSENTALMPGQIIYVKPKKSEGFLPSYVVKPGDSVHSIAQETGIKTKYIYKYNNLQEGASLEPGQEIFLKKTKQSRR